MNDASDLVALRGAVREGVAGIQNLGQLLRSPRVGTRALALAVPAVREGAEGLRVALSALEEALCEHLAPGAEAEAARSVLVFAAQRTSELTRVLEHGADGPAGARAAGARANPRVGARRRLEIEAEVMSLLAELATVQALIDLFASPGPPRTAAAQVDLGEILGEVGAGPRPGPSIEVSLDLGEDRTFVGDARQAAALIELAIAVVVDRARSAPLRLSAARATDGRLGVRLRRYEARPASAGVEVSVRAPLHASIPPLSAALAPAARRAGFEATVSEDQAEVTIVL